MSDNDDPFRFVQDTRPSWYQQLLSDVLEFLTRSFGFDTSVWMGRIVVSLVIVLVWDAYWKPPQQRIAIPRQPKHKPPPNKNQHPQPQPQSQEHPIPQAESNNPLPKGEVSESLTPSSLSPPMEEEKKSPALSDPKTTTATSTTTAQEPGRNIGDSPDTPPATTSLSSAPEATVTSETNSKKKNGPVVCYGLAGFHHWYEVETSLYRIYTLAHKDASVQTIPPYVPNSQRGRVSIEIRVINRTGKDINVYWVDYKGNHVPKGMIRKASGVWTQTTWIDHPWVFEEAATGTIYLYYVPYRVIPTISQAPTVGSDRTTGAHEFAIVETNNEDETPFRIGISDQVLPFPGSQHLDQPLKAINWTLLHLSRVSASARSSDYFALETTTLQKYLLNIMNNPETWKYRNLRIASQKFDPIWNSPLRGLLLAVGFVEDCGFCNFGSSEEPISSHKVQEIALLSYLLSEWTRKSKNGGLEQPIGASDGFGRAGFGRAGAMR